MKKTLITALTLLASVTFAQHKADFHQWAATPPMGWNSWDCFGRQ
jgi:hypothetical protein